MRTENKNFFTRPCVSAIAALMDTFIFLNLDNGKRIMSLRKMKFENLVLTVKRF